MPDARRRVALVVADNPEVAACIGDAVAHEVDAVQAAGYRRWPGDLAQASLKTAGQHLEAFWHETIAGLAGDLVLMVNVLPSLPTLNLAAVDLAAFRRMELTHIIHPWFGLKYALGAMKTGAIVTVGRPAASSDLFGPTATHALSLMTQCATMECAARPPLIRINTLDFEAVEERAADAAAAVAFLAGQAADFMVSTRVAVGRP